MIKMKGFFKVLPAVLVLMQLVHSWRSVAQVLPVGLPALEDKYRRDQLLGKIDSNISFSIRPLTNQALLRSNIYDSDSLMTRTRGVFPFGGDEGLVQIMPIVWEQQTTSAYPYGWNDGAMIPAVGYQTFFAAGVYAKYKWFSVQLRPELVIAENRDYMGYNGDNHYAWQRWYSFANNIDMPEQFGQGRYTKLLPGQSSIRFNYKSASIGLSTENLWWGPGRQNSLLMSNTAPGFPHITLNTTKPVTTGIGSFEGQLIAGRLTGSGYPPTRLGNPDHFDEYYLPKRDDWRYISGATFSYQPKWLPGLFVGMSRSFITYSEDLGGGLNSYLPFLGPGSKVGEEDNIGKEERMNRDIYASVHARWVMNKGNAEVYVEYGRTDPAWNVRDLRVQMDHSRGYVFGFRKLVPINREREEMFQIAAEVTQLERNRTSTIRVSPSWYTDSRVRHGYTHLGQVIGAGIGPGSNVQSVDLSWIRGLKQIGISGERMVHHGDFFYHASTDFRRKWVDLGLTAFGEWDFNNIVLSGRIQYLHAYNYQYELEIPEVDWKGFWHFLPQDKANWRLRLGAMYRF